MKITIIIGSVRKRRQSHRVGYFLEKLLVDSGVAATVIDLAGSPLPFYGTQAETAEVRSARRLLRESDALLLVTPEYQGSFSGVLKNALDYFREEVRKKPVGVASVSTGKFGGINASSQLQHVILSMGAYPLPGKLIVPEIHQVFDTHAKPGKDNFVNISEKFLREFLWFADAIYQKKNQEREGERVPLKDPEERNK